MFPFVGTINEGEKCQPSSPWNMYCTRKEEEEDTGGEAPLCSLGIGLEPVLLIFATAFEDVEGEKKKELLAGASHFHVQ